MLADGVYLIRQKFKFIVDSGLFTFSKNVYRSKLYVGNVPVKVSANKTMNESRSLVRHLSTVLLYSNKEMKEVQVAVNHAKKTLYVARNERERDLIKILPSKFSELEIPEIPSSCEREARHARKLKVEREKFGEYALVHKWVKNGQHAETEIVETIGDDFDYIGGTRRPCLACYIYFIIRKIPQYKYNPHHGAYWDSNNALVSLLPYTEQINDDLLAQIDGKFYQNESLSGNSVHDYDTDSDDED